MGFADLSIADIAAEYNLPVAQVCYLREQLAIAYKTQETNLVLEDAKAIISKILSEDKAQPHIGGMIKATPDGRQHLWE
jgi:hypothetical protein